MLYEVITVDVGSGKVEIYYDNKRLKDLSRVAEAITASGKFILGLVQQTHCRRQKIKWMQVSNSRNNFV